MIREQLIELDGISLNYARGPENGPPLALFHGVTRRWQTFMPLWSQLATRWQMLAWDARGHGRSDRCQGGATGMEGSGGYQVVDYVSDAVQFVPRLFPQPGVIYGHSLGAMVALAAAAAVPDSVRAIILEDPPFTTMGDRIAQTPLRSFFAGLIPFAGHQRPLGSIARELAEIRLDVPGKNQTVRLGDSRDATALRFTAKSLMNLDPQVLLDIVSERWLSGYDFSRLLAQVQCPVLLLQADAACGAMLSDADAELMNETLTDYPRIRFPAAPHLIHWSQPELLLRHVLGFLESIS